VPLRFPARVELTPNFSQNSPRIEGSCWALGEHRRRDGVPQIPMWSPAVSTFWCAPSPIWVSAGPFFESLWGRTFLVGLFAVFLGGVPALPFSPAAAAAARASRMAWCTVIALRGGV